MHHDLLVISATMALNEPGAANATMFHAAGVYGLLPEFNFNEDTRNGLTNTYVSKRGISGTKCNIKVGFRFRTQFLLTFIRFKTQYFVTFDSFQNAVLLLSEFQLICGALVTVGKK